MWRVFCCLSSVGRFSAPRCTRSCTPRCSARTPTAADKLTKPVWLAILGVAALLCLLFGVSVLGMTIAAVATGVYLADVRPKLLEVQGKSR